MIVANLQVLKIVEFSFYPEPIALGKMAICFTFLGSDILAECFGKKSAFKGVYIGFTANIFLIFLMLITIGYPPANVSSLNLHQNLKTVFTPTLSIFIAGGVTFIISQILDITIFLKIKEKFTKQTVWIRSFISTSISSLIDNILFYTFALYIFNSFVDFDTLVYSYILGTLIFRLIIIFFSSFIIVFIKKIINCRP
tara:strand:- start:2158 stop:2748 length:591 start_codon:yes stop_codon:yes gene_type:complete